MAIKVETIIEVLEHLASLAYQENYDNCGLLLGNKNNDCTGVLICLDITKEIVQEALEKKCNLIISHHPLIFHPLKILNTQHPNNEIIVDCIKNDINVYAIHTNLDNVKCGVIFYISQKLNLQKIQILNPFNNVLKKLVTFLPTDKKDVFLEKMFQAGVEQIGNYDECSFSVLGAGTFRGNDLSTPYVGEKNKRHLENEVRIEMIYKKDKEKKILETLFTNHPYETPAYDLISLGNDCEEIGSGMIGELECEMHYTDF